MSTCRQNHCRELLGELTVAYVASSGTAAQQAATWYCLYKSARLLDVVHWSAGAPTTDRISLTANSSNPSSSNNSSSTNSSSTLGSICQAEPLLARYGHSTIAAGALLVLVGGMLRDGAHQALDVSVLDLVGRRMIQPRLSGAPPPALRHLCTALVALEQGSLLHRQVGTTAVVVSCKATACANV